MRSLKSAAVVLQNYIQYESFVNAIDIMIENNIETTILVPIEKNDLGFQNMFDTIYNYLKDNTNYNIKRTCEEDEYYDMLFMPYPIEQFLNIRRTYTIKYMYSLVTKPWHSLSPNSNNIFDVILTYGMTETPLKTYANVFPIGNIKYLKFEKDNKKNDKINLLYLPTYGEDSDMETIIPRIAKLKNRYHLAIKAHHGTNYLTNNEETNRRQLIENNFDTIYSSEDSLLKLLADTDIVIADNESGAIWDAICTKVPVIICDYNLVEKDYNGYVAEHYKAIKKQEILVIDKDNDIEKIIEKTLTKGQKNKQEQLFKRIFYCENKETNQRFLKFLSDLDNKKIITDDELFIHQTNKEYIENLKNEIKYYIEIVNKKELEKEQLIAEFNEFKNSVYNSNSWKITKPLRSIKQLINGKK